MIKRLLQSLVEKVRDLTLPGSHPKTPDEKPQPNVFLTWGKNITKSIKSQISKGFFSVLEKLAVVAGHAFRLWNKPGMKANIFALFGVYFAVTGVSGLTTADVGRILLAAFLLFAAWRNS